ncbi:MAG: anti-sigma factor family protein [Candidatus Oleimicrobiaceae bacterium]
MKCAKVHKLLVLFWDGELPERRARRVAAHLQACRACAHRAEVLMRVWQSATPPPELVPAAALWYRVKARTLHAAEDLRPKAEVRTRWVPALATVGVVVLGIATGLLLSKLVPAPAGLALRTSHRTSPEDVEALSHRLVFDQLPPSSLPRVYVELAELSDTRGQR